MSAESSASGFSNLVEPAGMLEHFRTSPPQDFALVSGPAGLPGLLLDYDLRTTLDGALRDTLNRGWLGKCLKPVLSPSTLFWGSTVTEYAPLPARMNAGATVDALLDAWQRRSALMIIKDMPESSPLLGKADNAHADAVVAEAVKRGFIVVEGQALAYVEVDTATEEEYLARLSSGCRRDIRRKLKARERLQIEIRETGDACFNDETLLDEMYALYLAVYEQSEIHFDLLTSDFFKAILHDGSLQGRVFFYRHAEQLIGYNLCFVHQDLLVDKYIGLRYPQARQHNLYFISWMENLAYARAHGLRHYVAGWTDPEIKAYLGARFTFTRHVVWVKNPVLRFVLRRLAHLFESDRSWFEAREQARNQVQGQTPQAESAARAGTDS